MQKIYIKPSRLFKPFHLKGRYTPFSLIYDVPKIVSAVRKLERKENIDILHINNISHVAMSIVSKLQLQKKTLVHFFNVPHFQDVLCSPFVSTFICTSKMAWSYLQSKGIAENKIKLVPPIIDCVTYHPMSATKCKEQLGISRESFLVTYIGNLYPQRFPPQTIRSIQKVSEKYPTINLAIFAPNSIQNRSLLPTLKYLLQKSRVKHLIILSNLSEFDRNLVYNASDVIIFPSIKKISGIIAVDPPLTILESMACGKIVIASNTLSIGEVIQNGENGFLVAPGNFDEISITLEKVIKGNDDMRMLEASARRTIQSRFSREVSNQLIQTYEMIAQKTASS
jgi:glycosyltransferase involved in cell wall biosynthesis